MWLEFRRVLFRSGYMEEMDTERIEFYIYPIIMILQFCLIWRACNLTTRCIYEDELNGTIYYICNQVFSRAELAVAKFIWMVLRFGIVYGLNVMIVSIAMVLGSGEDMAEYVLLLPKGIIVGTFFIVITLLFCMIRKKNHYYEYDIRIQLLLLVPIIASNLYKIVNVFCWVGNYIGVGDKLFNSFDEIILLKYLSPLSWLNPYLGYSNEKQITYFFILATISILCCLAYVHLYKKRNFNYFLSNWLILWNNNVKITILRRLLYGYSLNICWWYRTENE